MSISTAAAQGAGPAVFPAGFEDIEKSTRGGFAQPAGEGLRFADLIDAINPLQHIPIVSTVYRKLTGDEINPAARVVGGLIYGGPAGALTAGLSAGLEEAVGAAAPTTLAAEAPAELPPAPSAVAMAAATTAAAPAATATAAGTARRAAEPPAAEAKPAPAKPASQDPLPLTPAAAPAVPSAPARAGGKDIRAYIAESMPARTAAAPKPKAAPPATDRPATDRPAGDGKAAGKAHGEAAPAPGWFADRMLTNLDRYRAAAGAGTPPRLDERR